MNVFDFWMDPIGWFVDTFTWWATAPGWLVLANLIWWPIWFGWFYWQHR